MFPNIYTIIFSYLLVFGSGCLVAVFVVWTCIGPAVVGGWHPVLRRVSAVGVAGGSPSVQILGLL